ncbi:uncharacterized protein LOC132614427 [Lycium barbarum]|uniref:uncharacterized protein LOC132614427 n=1 Tax=Lycium barbarum TaxID=112863 RepID=UPI00293E1526|nr:uncharacterized protein LOC132614427 [Lycium barbarum]
MALSQFFQSACTIVLGHGNNSSQEKIHKIDQQKKMNNFQMPLHYPRYKKVDYEKMEEWRLDILLKQYGFLNFNGTMEEKRKFAIGAFLWPDQL